MNITMSRDIVTQLHEAGVGDIVLCAGARNSPLVMVLSQMAGIELHSFAEERVAAFFALGIARRKGQPVAVLTTSGTAACELLPAVVEAWHTGVPLVLVTADRPRRLRGTGAPQAIDQTGLFAKFVQLEFDLEGGEMFSLRGWNRRSPAHVNVCFDEPLIDEAIEPFTLDPASSHPSFAGLSTFASSAGVAPASLLLGNFLRGEGPLAVVVGTLETREEREAVVTFLLKLNAPVYLESTSGLRERRELLPLALRSGDRILSWGIQRGLVKRGLRIGGVPTARVWRDFDNTSSSVEVMSLTALPFAGLSRGQMVCAPIAPVLDACQWPGCEVAGALLVHDRGFAAELAALLEAEPTAEPAMVYRLSCLRPDDAVMYVGNSLPIREWDLAASYERPVATEANRGVNGIDGQIATFLGIARGDASENWAMIGDLTALYDLAAPWALATRPGVRARIVIVNNGGGKIFSRIFRSDLFTNRHNLDFEPWARFWKLGYRRWARVPRELPELSPGGIEIIEMTPDEPATSRFWSRYDALWV